MAPPVTNGGQGQVRLSHTPSPDNSKKAAHKKQQQQQQQQQQPRRDLQSRSGLNTGGSAASAHVSLPPILLSVVGLPADALLQSFDSALVGGEMMANGACS